MKSSSARNIVDGLMLRYSERVPDVAAILNLMTQSGMIDSTARMVMASFDDGRGGIELHEIAGSYVEFAERRVLPDFSHLPKDQIQRQHRREGFEAGNADRIFESTYRDQTGKNKT